MNHPIKNRKIVVVNQAVNYLTIGLCNAFKDRFEKVALITGGIHTQGEELHPSIKVSIINKWYAKPFLKKLSSSIFAMVSMYFLLLTKYRNYEVIYVSVPPMLYLLNLGLPNKSAILVWDIFPDGLKITGMKETHIIYKAWSYLNCIAFKKAEIVFTISDVMGDLLTKYVSKDKIIVQPIWSIFQENDKVSKENNPFVEQHKLENKFIVQYSGNIGLAHRVEIMIELAEKMIDYPDILFQIIGKGPRKEYLEKLVHKKNLPNCQFLPFQSDEMFPYSLSAADLGVVILDAVTAHGSVPSKSYNLMAYGIPSLYFAAEGSQLALYAQKYSHAASFTYEQMNKAVQYVLSLKNDRDRYLRASENALYAASDFKRGNADKFVVKYLEKTI